MKIVEDFYHIQTADCKKAKSFLSFSDIHYGTLQQMFYKGTMKKFFDYLVEKNKDVEAIFIPGDLLFYLTNFKDKNFLVALINDLENLVNRLGVPIFISYGNHDLPLNEQNLSEEEKRKLDLGHYLDNRKKGIYVLDNEQVSFNDVVITGFSPRRDDYSPNSMPSCLFKVKECFERCHFEFSKGSIHIFLSHENKFLTHPSIISEYGELYESLTCIIGGHLHDGYMPLWLQALCKESLKDYGIWEKIPPKINMCRGLFKVSQNSISEVIFPNEIVRLSKEECASIVNRGVAKYSWFLPSTPSYTKIQITDNAYQAEDGSYWVDETSYQHYQEKEKRKYK